MGLSLNRSVLLSLITLASVPGAFAAITFDSSVPPNQKTAMEGDLKYLHQLGIPVDGTGEAARIMGITGIFNTSSLETWLEDRVSTIVSETWDPNAAVHVSKDAFSYPNPGVLPTVETAPDHPNEGTPGTPVTVMANLGAAIYYSGKAQNAPFEAQLDNGTVLPVHSPRVGIIQIGQGLFMQSLQPNGANLASRANTAFRLSVFFHEARHSDGNGKSLIFAHAVCPPGHDFAGYYACDRNLNGPYTVGAHILKVFAKSCTECNAGEKEVLNLVALDSFGRILRKYHPPVDQLTVLTLEANKLGCEREKGPKSPECMELANQLNALKNNAEISAVEWDASPEGQR